MASTPNSSPYLSQTFVKKSQLSRRHFLRGAGVMMALPLLSAMRPAFARDKDLPTEPRRMIGICNNLGLIPKNFFPETAGRDYELSPYLKVLEEHRNDFTVFSGVSHPDVDGGHPADNCFLTAAPHPGNGGFKNTISLDQYAANYIGNLTRFPSLTLGVNVSRGSKSLSWTNSGALIPCEEKPSVVFKKLFIQGSAEEVKQTKKKLELGQSIMDTVADQAKQLSRDVGPRDRERLDQYFTGVRELESRLGDARSWEDKPKPKVEAKIPIDPASPKDYMEKIRLMYDMVHLAFETDSTRLVTLMLDSVNSPTIEVEGEIISDGYHSLSHHGNSPDKVRQLEAIDKEHLRLLGKLMASLKGSSEADTNLFERTMILYGSNFGNANTHVTTNLPLIFAGGGFKHGQHLVFDKTYNYPLPNLFVSMLQRLGLETSRFATSTGTMKGLAFS